MKELVKLAKKLKKNAVAVDVVNFGEDAENLEKLQARPINRCQPRLHRLALSYALR